MVHYIYSHRTNPFNQPEYAMKHCPFGDNRQATIVCLAVAISALVGIYSAITILFGT